MSFHGGEDLDCGLLGYDTMQSGTVRHRNPDDRNINNKSVASFAAMARLLAILCTM
jgi:hypothetical protein